MQEWTAAPVVKARPAPPGAAAPAAMAVEDGEGRRQKRRLRGKSGEEPARAEGLDEVVAATARLALTSEKEVRLLKGWVQKTTLLPEGSLHRRLSEAGVVLMRDEPWSDEHAPARVWARLVLAAMEEAAAPTEAREVLAAHVAAMRGEADLVSLVQETRVVKTHEGTQLKLQFVVEPELQNVARALCRVLLAAGGTLKNGPAPPGPQARALKGALRRAGMAFR